MNDSPVVSNEHYKSKFLFSASDIQTLSSKFASVRVASPIIHCILQCKVSLNNDSKVLEESLHVLLTFDNHVHDSRTQWIRSFTEYVLMKALYAKPPCFAAAAAAAKSDHSEVEETAFHVP